jgi:anti-sigma regulatory factor (Ser/Thr protein kinase)
MSENASHPVEILLPLSERWARLVRLFVAGAAQQCGASISLIDDAKLVSEEAFLLGLAVSDAERQVTIAVSCADGGIRMVVGGLPARSADERTCGRYSLFILNALATETRWISHDGSVDLEVLLTEREADE